MKKINTILIANRGEIANRIIKTAKKLNIKTVAIYSDFDKNALHVKKADSAFYLSGKTIAETYLNIDKIIAIAKKANVDAIHPGYGFLSENAHFAQKVIKENIIFIGPSSEAITKMGSKAHAKSLMSNANVPLTPGYHGDDQSETTLINEAKNCGFPILLKAASGGGGKGMRIVNHEQELKDAIMGAKREAKSSFGDDRLIIEKYITNPRHIEIQIMADNHGEVLYIFERDCSIQRRYQKIIEEAPAPFMTDDLRQQMGQAAVNAAKAINYSGAGTVEFLLDSDGKFYFMEMNTRLQVEHPITEMITQLDLVELQIHVAENKPLPINQQDLKIQGHAFEVRIYAEDPANHFLPSTGLLQFCEFPKENQHVRIDTGVTTDDEISIHYDPMIAKLIVWDKNRDLACQQLQHALKQTHIIGLKTNIDFLSQIVAHQAFRSAKINTHFIADYFSTINASNKTITSEHLAAACLYFMVNQEQHNSPWQQQNDWQINLPATRNLRFIIQDQVTPVSITKESNHYQIAFQNQQIRCHGYFDEKLYFTVNDQNFRATIIRISDCLHIIIDNELISIDLYNPTRFYQHSDKVSGLLTSPMPGTIISILTKKGDNVVRGDKLLIMEAMKMEHTIEAPNPGIVKEIHYNVGDQVAEGVELIKIEETN